MAGGVVLRQIMVANLEHSANARSPMEATEEGMIKDVKLLQL
jgi:hypothetical protein